MKNSKCVVLCLLFLVQGIMVVLLWTVFCGAEEQDANLASEIVVEMLPVRHRPAADLLPAVRTALSPEGRASADRVGNRIVVNDTSDRVQRIRSLIRDLDVRVAQVVVRLRFRHRQEGGRRILSTTAGIHGTRTGRRMASRDLRGEKNLMLRISSGASGYLRVGTDIPVTAAWISLCGRYGVSAGMMSGYRRLETGFEVMPLVLGDQVDLTLVPRLTLGRGELIRLADAATRIRVPPNTWVRVAAAEGSEHGEALDLVLDSGEQGSVVMDVLCEVRR